VSEADETPKEESDTPLEALIQDPSMADVLSKADLLLAARSARKKCEQTEAEVMEELLPLMRAKELHGVRFADGTAVRRRWSPNRPTIDPVKLTAKLADAPEFIEAKVVVDQARLRAAYPELWRELGGKVNETIVVAEPKKKA
jgi:hypothetical protein